MKSGIGMLSTDDLDRMLRHINKTYLKESPIELMHLNTPARKNTVLKIKTKTGPWMMIDTRRNVNNALNMIIVILEHKRCRRNPTDRKKRSDKNGRQ